MKNPRYIVGIDLGTTNSVVAYTPADFGKTARPDIRVLEIPQLTGPGVVESRRMLPSAVMLFGSSDVAPEALGLPWPSEAGMAVGEFARERGAELPHRLIVSAKSWLCNRLVDRNQPILPWQGPGDIPKLSPVEASARILAHIRDAWDHTVAGGDEGLRLANQEILLTVPASFDAVARDLTVRAAEMAGLAHITLIEEPMAAFYAWIQSAGDRWRQAVRQGDLVLVCDIGGGTSDFSLIRVSEENGSLALERIAVGEHLLLGGDNMDLALAHAVARKLAAGGTRLDAWQMRGLWSVCRKAKEYLFENAGLREVPVSVLGRGSSLIGGTIRTAITLEEVEEVLLDGFLPRCRATDRPGAPRAAGIKELGLSYEADPAVTHHLARFLARQSPTGNPAETLPTAVLFNGGVMKARSLRNRLLEVFASWGTSPASGGIREIESTDLDLAVARGAVTYGMARRGNGIRIRGGLSKAYYIGVAASMPAVPGLPAPTKALCLAPFGLEEGQTITLSRKQFSLVVGEPVHFDFLASLSRLDDRAGEIVEDWQGEIEPVTTLETALEGEPGSTVPVTLEVRATEIGTLEIWCVPPDGSSPWKLEFNVREQAQDVSRG